MFYAKRWTAANAREEDYAEETRGPFRTEERARQELKNWIRESIMDAPAYGAPIDTMPSYVERHQARLWALLLAFIAAEDSKAELYGPAADVRAHGRTSVDGLAFGVYGTETVSEREARTLSTPTIKSMAAQGHPAAIAELDRRNAPTTLSPAQLAEADPDTSGVNYTAASAHFGGLLR